MLKVYGIKNCDTVRKALKWLDGEGIAHEFQDFRANPVSADQVQTWEGAVGRDVLINKRGTTYRKLEEGEKAALDGESPFQMLADNPTLMKRPVFEKGGEILIGFTEKEKSALLG